MTYLAAAFIILWLSVALYVAFMLSRQRKLEQEIEMLEEQMSEQHTANDRWKIATGGLAVAAVLLFVIGTALGAKTRQSYDSATRRVGRTHTSGVNGTRNHMGETGTPDRHQTMAA